MKMLAWIKAVHGKLIALFVNMSKRITSRSSMLRAFGPARDVGFAAAPYRER